MLSYRTVKVVILTDFDKIAKLLSFIIDEATADSHFGPSAQGVSYFSKQNFACIPSIATNPKK